MNDMKKNDLWKCYHCQRRGHLTEKHISKLYGHPPNAAETAANLTTKVPVIQTPNSLIVIYLGQMGSIASASDLFLDN